MCSLLHVACLEENSRKTAIQKQHGISMVSRNTSGHAETDQTRNVGAMRRCMVVFGHTYTQMCEKLRKEWDKLHTTRRAKCIK